MLITFTTALGVLLSELRSGDIGEQKMCRIAVGRTHGLRPNCGPCPYTCETSVTCPQAT
jgi:hypothetical protein